MLAQVLAARQRQRVRLGEKKTMLNARMGPRLVRQHCALDSTGELVLKQAMTELGLSARAHDKVLRVARTIADLEGSERIKPEHVSEAIHYRQLDRQQ
jgi:magnesium chelatase family protein